MSLPLDYDDAELFGDFEMLFRLDDDLEMLSEQTENVVEYTVPKDTRPRSLIKEKSKKSRSVKNVAKFTGEIVAVARKKQSGGEPRLTWRSFPSFDRSDSTLYFASTFARLSNNGNEEELKKLITAHCSKDVQVVLREGSAEWGGFSVPLNMYMDMLTITNILYPDMMTCMHSTKVIGNQIHAVLYSKQTDCAEMYDYRECAVDSKYKWIYVGRRKELFIRNLGLDGIEASKRKAILKLLDLNVDVQMYSRINITLTLHSHTKKAIDFTYISTPTSIFYEGVHYPVE